MDKWRVKAHKVDAIRDRADIKRIRDYFMARYRYGEEYCLLWTLGINFGLRASDLRTITYGQMRQPECFEITERKTNKLRIIYINEAAREAFEWHKRRIIFAEDTAWIFGGQKHLPIDVKHIHKIIKKACRDLNIPGNYGSHTMRKTFAYHAYRQNPTKQTFALIRECFDHSTNTMTRLYTGEAETDADGHERSEDKERTIKDIYMGLNL